MRYDTAAKKVAAAGRYGDTELVHVSKDEIDLFNSISPIPLTTNPKTGAKEAFFFLPMLGGLLGSNLLGGTLAGALGSTALGTAAGSAIGSGIGSLIQGDDPLTAAGNAAMGGIGSYATGALGGMLGDGATGAIQSASPEAAVGASGVMNGLAGSANPAGVARMAANIGMTGVPNAATASGSAMAGRMAANIGRGGGAAASSTSPTGGIMGWIKDNPLLAAGGAALALPMLTGSGGTPKSDKKSEGGGGGGGWAQNPYTGGDAVFPGEGYKPGKDPEWDYYAPFRSGGIVRFAGGGGVGNASEGEHGSAFRQVSDALPARFAPFDPNAPQAIGPNAPQAMKTYAPPPMVNQGGGGGGYYAQYMMDQNARRSAAPNGLVRNVMNRMGSAMGDGGLAPLTPLGLKGFAEGGPVTPPWVQPPPATGIAALGSNIAEGIDNNVRGNIEQNGPMASLGRGMAEAIDPQDPVVIGVVKAIKGEGGDPKPAIKAFIQKYGADALERLMTIYGPGGIAEKQSRQMSDGMSDSVPAQIEGQQPAALSEGEFVVPADAVSGLGNGSTEAGAKTLQQMIDRVRQARTGTAKQAKQVEPVSVMPA